MAVSAGLLIELGVILVVLTVVGSAARRYGLSPIPLYLLAGLFMGNGGVPVPEAAEFVETGASIGVVLLLLTLGLEFSVVEFTASLRRHLPSAAVDLVLNATPGAIAGWLLGLDGAGVLAMAGVTYISSSGVIARLLGDLRRDQARVHPAQHRQLGDRPVRGGVGHRDGDHVGVDAHRRRLAPDLRDEVGQVGGVGG